MKLFGPMFPENHRTIWRPGALWVKHTHTHSGADEAAYLLLNTLKGGGLETTWKIHETTKVITKYYRLISLEVPPFDLVI